MQLFTETTENSVLTQTNKFETTSDKYKLIQTNKVIDIFQDNGLVLHGESIVRPRKKEKVGFQKHLLAFTRDDLFLGDEQLQLLLLNSHDGTCSFQLSLGVFRFACANGLISGDVESTMKIRHTGNALDRLDVAIAAMLDKLPTIAEKITTFKSIELTPDQRKQFIFDAAKLRIGDQVKQVDNCNPKRAQDLSIDLWTTFNRVQEYIIQGGLRYVDKENKLKKTRKLSAVNTTVKLNKELWNLAERWAG